MERNYERHTNGTSVSGIKIDSSSVFDKVIIEFTFMNRLFKRFTIEVKYQDIGNNTGADFSNLKELEEKIKQQSCNSFKITPVKSMGILLHFSAEKIFVPIYDHITDYYNNDVDLTVTYQEFDEKKNVKKKEITDFNAAILTSR